MSEKKPCEVTLKASTRKSIIISAVSVVVTSVLLIFIFNILTNRKIALFFTKPRKQKNIVLEYLLIKKKVRLIKKGLKAAMIKRKAKINRWGQLTRKETEYYASVLSIAQHYENLDVLGFIANTSGESEFNKLCKSKAKTPAYGLNQIIVVTFKEFRGITPVLYNIFSVYHNTQIGVRYWLHCRERLRKVLGRKPTVAMISMGYNCGINGLIKDIRRGKNWKRYLPKETRKHGRKIKFYYDNYKKGNYEVYFK